jgi:hypothetical protein
LQCNLDIEYRNYLLSLDSSIKKVTSITMKLQVLEDSKGKQTGVFVPIDDWTLIKNSYPDIETLDQDLPQWEKDLIDKRLEAIQKNPQRLRPISELLDELNRKV